MSSDRVKILAGIVKNICYLCMEDSDATIDTSESGQGSLEHFGFLFLCSCLFQPLHVPNPSPPWFAAQIAVDAGRFKAKGALAGIICLAYLHVIEEVSATVAWEVYSWSMSTSSEHLSRHQLVPRLQTCLPKFQPQIDANRGRLLILHVSDAGKWSVKVWVRVMWSSISSKRTTRLLSQGIFFFG